MPTGPRSGIRHLLRKRTDPGRVRPGGKCGPKQRLKSAGQVYTQIRGQVRVLPVENDGFPYQLDQMRPGPIRQEPRGLILGERTILAQPDLDQFVRLQAVGAALDEIVRNSFAPDNDAMVQMMPQPPEKFYLLAGQGDSFLRFFHGIN